VLRRTRKGTSPFAPDKQHLHHRLLDLGHGQQRAVVIMATFTAVIAFGAVSTAFIPMWITLILVAVGLVTLVGWVFNPPRETITQ